MRGNGLSVSDSILTWNFNPKTPSSGISLLRFQRSEIDQRFKLFGIDTMPRLRVDGRGQNELRELNATLGQLDRADGSAQFGFGKLSLMYMVQSLILQAGLQRSHLFQDP